MSENSSNNVAIRTVLFTFAMNHKDRSVSYRSDSVPGKVYMSPGVFPDGQWPTTIEVSAPFVQSVAAPGDAEKAAAAAAKAEAAAAKIAKQQEKAGARLAKAQAAAQKAAELAAALQAKAGTAPAAIPTPEAGTDVASGPNVEL